MLGWMERSYCTAVASFHDSSPLPASHGGSCLHPSARAVQAHHRCQPVSRLLLQELMDAYPGISETQGSKINFSLLPMCHLQLPSESQEEMQ